MILDAQPSSESSSPLRFETLGYIAIDCLPIRCSINRAPINQAAEDDISLEGEGQEKSAQFPNRICHLARPARPGEPWGKPWDRSVTGFPATRHFSCVSPP